MVDTKKMLSLTQIHDGYFQVGGQRLVPRMPDVVGTTDGSGGRATTTGRALVDGLGDNFRYTREDRGDVVDERTSRQGASVVHISSIGDDTLVVDLAAPYAERVFIEATFSAVSTMITAAPDSMVSKAPRKSIFEPLVNQWRIPAEGERAQPDVLAQYLESGMHAMPLLGRLLAFGLEHLLVPFTGRLRPTAARDCYLNVSRIEGDRTDQHTMQSGDLRFRENVAPAHGGGMLHAHLTVFVGPAGVCSRGKALLACLGRRGGPVYALNRGCWLNQLFEEDLGVILVGDGPLTRAFPNVQSQDFVHAYREALSLLQQYNGVTGAQCNGMLAHIVQNLHIVDIYSLHELGTNGELAYNIGGNAFGRRDNTDADVNQQVDDALDGLIGNLGAAGPVAELGARARRDYFSCFVPAAEGAVRRPDPEQYATRPLRVVDRRTATWMRHHAVNTGVGGGNRVIQCMRRQVHAPEPNEPMVNESFSPSFFEAWGHQFMAGRGAGRFVVVYTEVIPMVPGGRARGSGVNAAQGAPRAAAGIAHTATRISSDPAAQTPVEAAAWAQIAIIWGQQLRQLNQGVPPADASAYYVTDVRAFEESVLILWEGVDFLDAVPHAYTETVHPLRPFPNTWGWNHGGMTQGHARLMAQTLSGVVADLGPTPPMELVPMIDLNIDNSGVVLGALVPTSRRMFHWTLAAGRIMYTASRDAQQADALRRHNEQIGHVARRSAYPRELLLPLGGMYTSMDMEVVPGLWPVLIKPFTTTATDILACDPLAGLVGSQARGALLFRTAASADMGCWVNRLAPIRIDGPTCGLRYEQDRLRDFPINYETRWQMHQMSAAMAYGSLTVYRACVVGDRQAEALSCTQVRPTGLLRNGEPRVGLGLGNQRFLSGIIPTRLCDRAIFCATGYVRGTYLAKGAKLQSYYMGTRVRDGVYGHYSDEHFPGVGQTMNPHLDDLVFRVHEWEIQDAAAAALAGAGAPRGPGGAGRRLVPVEWRCANVAHGFKLETPYLMGYDSATLRLIPHVALRWAVPMEAVPCKWAARGNADAVGTGSCSSQELARHLTGVAANAQPGQGLGNMVAGVFANIGGGLVVVGMDDIPDDASGNAPLPRPSTRTPYTLLLSPHTYVSTAAGQLVDTILRSGVLARSERFSQSAAAVYNQVWQIGGRDSQSYASASIASNPAVELPGSPSDTGCYSIDDVGFGTGKDDSQRSAFVMRHKRRRVTPPIKQDTSSGSYDQELISLIAGLMRLGGEENKALVNQLIDSNKKSGRVPPDMQGF